MRYGMILIAVLLGGCAHISHKDPEAGLEMTYTGFAHGAVELIEVAHDNEGAAIELADKAVDKGMSTSVRITDDGVSVSAGYGYTYGGNVGGYAPANTGYIPGQGFVASPPVSALPPLATSVVMTGRPTKTDSGIVPCPSDRDPATSAEQAACAVEGVQALTESRVK